MDAQTAEDMAQAYADRMEIASLHIDDPGDDGANEVAGGSYAQLPITWNAGAVDGEFISDTLSFDIPANTDIAYVGMWDGSSNFLDKALFEVSIGAAGSYDFVIHVLVDTEATTGGGGGGGEDPPPTSGTTLFGACPAYPGGTSLGAAQSVGDKYGSNAAVRQFFSGFSQVAHRPSGTSIMHCSWKPTVGSSFTDAQVEDAMVELLPGDVVEVWHEADKKERDGDHTYSALVDIKNDFYAAVKRVRPDLLVANTVTGWLLNAASGLDYSEWMVVDADVLGSDMDGIAPSSTSYINYPNTIPVVLAAQSEGGYPYWSVPEFGAKQYATDTAGTYRASWAVNVASALRDAGALYVCLYDYESTAGNEFTTAAEISAWSSVVAF